MIACIILPCLVYCRGVVVSQRDITNLLTKRYETSRRYVSSYSQRLVYMRYLNGYALRVFVTLRLFFLCSISSSASLVGMSCIVSRIARCPEDEALRRSVSYTLQYIIGSFKGFD